MAIITRGRSEVEPKAEASVRTAAARINLIIVAASCVIFLLIALYQLSLPGLYPDEAFDVIPTMQLLLGHPVELQRDAAVHIFGLALPLMSSSDYQGITSTYLALPFFAIGGINVISLRVMTVLVGVLSLVLAFYVARLWYGDRTARIAVILFAVSPAWIFWSRIGVYVVSEVVPITEGALIAFTLWTRARPFARRNSALYAGLFLLGLGLTTKLLYLWLILAVGATGALLYWRLVWQHRALVVRQVRLWISIALAGAGAFCLGAFPFLLYNAMTRGTLYVLRANSGETTHGVNNSAVLRNLWTEADALRVLLDGSYFWFQGVLGHVYYNPLTPSLFAISAIALGALAIGSSRSGMQQQRGRALPAVWGGGALSIALVMALILAIVQPVGSAASVFILVEIGAAGVATIWLCLWGMRAESNCRLASSILLAVCALSGAVWWFGGSGRADGANPGAAFGLWPVDAAGAMFWVTGAGLLFLLGSAEHPPAYARVTTALLALVGLVVAQSAVTVSGLWSTHLLLILPLPEIAIGAFLAIALPRILDAAKTRGLQMGKRTALTVAGTVLAVLVVLDLGVDYSYHRDLAITGGGSTFSDAVYSLVSYLGDQSGTKVVAMDWGFKRPVQLLTEERVNPIDAYGYTADPTPEFRTGATQLLSDPNTLYLFHTPEGTAYPRFDAFKQVAQEQGKSLELVKTFYHRDGVPVYLVYKAH